MGIADNINKWVEDRREAWGGALGKFLLGAISDGATKTLGDLEPGAINAYRDSLTKLSEDPDLPPELKTAIQKSLGEGNILNVVGGYLILLISVLPALLGGSRPLGNLMAYKQDLMLQSFRLDPATITRIWLRDKAAYEKLWADLKDQGWDEDKINVAKELAKIIPPLADMVRFADFSAFDPEVIAKWRQFYDAPGWVQDPFALLGITNEAPRDWANKYWFSHYVQPGRFELGEMYRRGLLGTPLIGQDEIGGGPTEGEAEETIKLAYRTMAYSEFWQDRLLQLVREVPTRVDVRRWWDMRTIDEAELRSIYQRRGYFGKDLENYVLWTKVYVAFPDIIARMKNGWISPEEAKIELAKTGLEEPRLTELWQTKIKVIVPDPVDEAKKVTQTAIIKWVKEDPVARWEQGVDLLIDLGYDEDGARFVLDAYIAEMGSPETYEEFKQLTEKWRKAAGRPEAPESARVREAAAVVVEATKDVEDLKRAVAEEQAKIVDEEAASPEELKPLKRKRVALHRAEAVLFKAKQDYDKLVAELRHAPPKP